MIFSLLVLSLFAGAGQVTGDPLTQALNVQARTYAFTLPSPGIHFSPRAAAAYAIRSGCVPAVATGRPAIEFFRTAAGSRKRDDGRYTVSTAVDLAEDGRGVCTVTAARGEPEQLREAVIVALDEQGAVRTVASDSGAGSRDSGGPFRQELHCLSLDGQPMFLVLSTSSASNRPRLMASLGRDTDGACRHRSGS